MPNTLNLSILTITEWSRSLHYSFISCLDLKNIAIDTKIMISHQIEIKNIANVTFLMAIIGAISEVVNAQHLGFFHVHHYWIV